MKYFSVPADFKKETIDAYDRLNRQYPDSKVIEIYGNLTVGNSFGCGRSISQLPQVDWQNLRDFVNHARSKNIDFNYTVNTSFMSNREFTRQGIKELKQFFLRLHEIGIRCLTITLPSLIELVHSMDLGFKIKASAICSIDNANIALAFKKMGVERIVTKELINRDFHTLRNIRRTFGDRIELIVNTPCHMDCSYRMSHYNQQAGDSITGTNDTSFNYYEHKCMHRRYSQLGNWLKISWIRPEDLKFYTEIGINYFKLQGRQTIKKGGDIVRTVEHYFKEDFDGNLEDLINCFAPMNSFKVIVDNKKLDGFITPFFERDNFCIRDCTQCDYCDRFAEKCVYRDDAEDISRMATTFYQQFDEYKKALKEIEPDKLEAIETKISDEGDFDF